MEGSFSSITIIVKTFERPRCLLRFLRSLQRCKVRWPILVADDSAHPYARQMASSFPDLRIEVYDLGFDSGLSEGRNHLLARTRSRFFVLCDDDFIFDERTSIDAMVRLLERHDVDVVGGEVFDIIPLGIYDLWVNLRRLRWRFFPAVFDRVRGRPRQFAGTFERTEMGGWVMRPVVVQGELTRCDYVSNFFLARTEVVRAKLGGWGKALKVGEHEDFFLRGKLAGLRVGFARKIGVLHCSTSPMAYLPFRGRAARMRRADIRYVS